jgi:hypothetical protein
MVVEKVRLRAEDIQLLHGVFPQRDTKLVRKINPAIE